MLEEVGTETLWTVEEIGVGLNALEGGRAREVIGIIELELRGDVERSADGISARVPLKGFSDLAFDIFAYAGTQRILVIEDVAAKDF